MHIPKTGGTTLSWIIQTLYQKSTLYSGQNILFLKDKIEQSEALLGHFHFGIHRHFSKPSFYITMLRDPVDRIISEYYYIKKEPSINSYISNLIKSNKMSLEEYVVYDEKFFSRPKNKQTRYFCGGQTPDLELAKKNLSDHFLIVGITELFDESVSLMKHELGWKNLNYLKRNVNNDKPLKNDFSTKTIDKIIENNTLDIELYQYSKDLLNKKLQNI